MDNSKQFCIFIDILGFKNKMKNFEDALTYYKRFFAAFDAFDRMHNSTVKEISNALNQNFSQDNSSSSIGNITFSDSIIFYSTDWKALLFRAANVMSFLLSSGFLFRGGVGYGKHYSDIQPRHTYIVSEGLVQAVEIESKISIYPRIVISESALKQILNEMEALCDLNNILIQSEDNLWFINPFFLNPDISEIYKQTECNIKKFDTEKFAKKYLWMKELCIYFREQQNIRLHPSDYYLNNATIPHFFYPKTFHMGIFGTKNYSLSNTIYSQSYHTNIDQIIQQESKWQG